MSTESELERLRGVVQAVEALAGWADHKFEPLNYSRHNCGHVNAEGRTCGKHAAKHELAEPIAAALAAAADAPQPADDAKTKAMQACITELALFARQHLRGERWAESFTPGDVLAIIGKHRPPTLLDGTPVPAPDPEALAEFMRATAGPSPAVLPQPSEDQQR